MRGKKGGQGEPLLGWYQLPDIEFAVSDVANAASWRSKPL